VKRDMDLIRELLLKLESLGMRAGDIVVVSRGDPDVALDGYSADQIDYHLSLLRERGLIECPGDAPISGGITFRRLTWEGHDFLDAVRDPDIWRKTKRGAEAAGSFTFDLVKDLAKGFVKTKIEEHTGVKL
jgi:DNA-binding transcriptional ArsR family regulator